MGKKQLIALANTIRNANMYDHSDDTPVFSQEAIVRLASFCQSQNPAFKRDRWIGYINGENDSNGGTVKA